jgi:hypothetical protein
MISRTPRLTLALILSALLPGLANAWIVYENMDDFFLINFPREPEVREFEHVSEYGAPLPAREYFVEEENGTRVSLTVINFNGALPKYQEIQDKTDDTNVRSMWIYDQRGSIAYEAAKLRQQASRILYERRLAPYRPYRGTESAAGEPGPVADLCGPLSAQGTLVSAQRDRASRRHTAGTVPAIARVPG